MGNEKQCPTCHNKNLTERSQSQRYEERAVVTGKMIRQVENGWTQYVCGCGWESEKAVVSYDVVNEKNKQWVQ